MAVHVVGIWVWWFGGLPPALASFQKGSQETKNIVPGIHLATGGAKNMRQVVSGGAKWHDVDMIKGLSDEFREETRKQLQKGLRNALKGDLTLKEKKKLRRMLKKISK